MTHRQPAMPRNGAGTTVRLNLKGDDTMEQKPIRRRNTAEKILGWEGLETPAGGQARFACDTAPETHVDPPAYAGGFYGDRGRGSMNGRSARDRIARHRSSNGTLVGRVRPAKSPGANRLAKPQRPRSDRHTHTAVVEV